MQEGSSDTHATLAHEFGIVSRHPDHAVIAVSSDRVRHPLIGRRAARRGPVSIKAFTGRINGHDRPAISIAVYRNADLVFEVRGERFQTQEPSCQRDKFKIHWRVWSGGVSV